MLDVKYRWIVLAVVFYVNLVFIYSFQALPPILPFLMVNFNISHAEAGLLMSAVAFPGIFLPVVIGVFADRVGLRFLSILAALFVALGTFATGWAESFIQTLTGRVVLGVGGAVAAAIIPIIISRSFFRGEVSRAMGIYNVNVPVAIVLAFSSVSILASAYGWRFPLQVCFILSIVSIPLLFFTVRGNLSFKGESLPLRALRKVNMWLVGVMWMLFNGAIVSFVTWGPKIFSESADLTLTEASLTLASMMVVAAVLTPFYGWLLDRFKAYRVMAFSGSAASALILAFLSTASSVWTVFAIILLGVFIAMVPPVVFTSPNWILKPHEVGVGFGILTLCLNVGAAFSPPMIGFILDLSGILSQALLMIAIIMASSALISLIFRGIFQIRLDLGKKASVSS
jgi:predicted MFS family arabinose efflux permease